MHNDPLELMDELAQAFVDERLSDCEEWQCLRTAIEEREARIVQLYDMLWELYASIHYHNEDENPDELCVNCTMNEAQYQYLESVLHETPQQSHAAILASGFHKFAHRIDARRAEIDLGVLDIGSFFSKALKDEARRLEREAAHGVNEALLSKSEEAQIDDLAMLVMRLCYSLKLANPGSELSDKALDYLERTGLQHGGILRNVIHNEKR